MAITNILGVFFFLFSLGGNYGGNRVVEYFVGEGEVFFSTASVDLLIKFFQPKMCCHSNIHHLTSYTIQGLCFVIYSGRRISSNFYCQTILSHHRSHLTQLEVFHFQHSSKKQNSDNISGVSVGAIGMALSD